VMLPKRLAHGAGQVVVADLDWSKAKHHIYRAGRRNTPEKQAGVIIPIWARAGLG
jgi:hypothetical protein